MDKNFCIKEEYVHKNGIANTALNLGSDYWNERRIDTSQYYQHSVYVKALDLAEKKFGKDFSVVDVGCGSGNKLMTLAYPRTKKVAGADQEYIIGQARIRYPEATWHVNDLENPDTLIGNGGDSYDLVICADVIEHLLDPDVLLSKIKSIMHDKSILLISTPERDLVRGIKNLATPHPEHIREWNTSEFKKYLSVSGFVVEEIKNMHAMKPHFGMLYFNFLRRNFWRTNYCMTAVCTRTNS
jgi:2-polyprenyl-3-methyl-5-hydroxy-6-metoxy-1,4-benzoquinol methylase